MSDRYPDITLENLTKWYVQDELSEQKIANRIGCSRATIQHFMSKFNIKRRPKTKKISKDDLYRLYFLENKDYQDIAQVYQCTWELVRHYRQEYGFPEKKEELVQARREQKYFDKTGYHHQSQNPEVVIRIAQTNIKTWNEPKIIEDRKLTCFKKYGQDNPLNPTKTHEEFLQDSVRVHNNEFEVLEEYKNATTKIKFKHKICGAVFLQTPHHYLSGCGCPVCNESKGEKQVRWYLEQQNIIYNPQHRFPNCRCINTLPFDFYLPKHNLCVEYDGKQHFEPIDYFGGEEAFKILQQHDGIKNHFCKENNIKLVRISYLEEDRICEILSAALT